MNISIFLPFFQSHLDSHLNSHFPPRFSSQPHTYNPPPASSPTIPYPGGLTTEMTTSMKPSYTPDGTPDPNLPPRYTYEIPIGLSVGFFFITIIIIIVIITIIKKRHTYRSLNGNNGSEEIEMQMEHPLIRNEAESQL